jgi:DEAD/DEAH box helicase domain-containing protein
LRLDIVSRLVYSGKEKAKMSTQQLGLFLPDSPQLPIPRRETGLESAVERFRQWMARENSPVRALHHEPAREGEFRDFPPELDERLALMLRGRGIERLYSHQAEAFGHIEAGRNTVIVTPTASGKTLCYNLPVMQSLLADPTGRVFYLFPTKALAEDQLQELQTALNQAGSDLKAFTYDGDTPQDARKAIRERAQLILTNPDMLHAGVLPHHTKWAKAFENLKYIVIDELHTYRGVYGSHLANILRRLKRICDFYGSKPRFICCSATIANPKELAEAVTGEPFDLVDRSGAPSGEKYFVFYNPPVVNQQLGIRRSYLHESRRIAVESIERGQQTLVFCNNRLATEILVKYLKESVERGQVPPEAVRGYRGGYLPKERREIEQKLRDGRIQAVVATSALELGIDLGSLDAVVLAGYPGTIAATWQRAGRAGRRQKPSLAVMVASSDPLDQYMIEHPEYFFGRSPERGSINADNLEILINHLKCAAFELPVQEDESFGPHPAAGMCEFLAESGHLHRSAGAWHWTSDTYPADAISLRSVSSDNFVVIDSTRENEVIAEVAFPAALVTLHEKAIYLHEARIYQVERMDYDQRKAYVRKVDCDYYTDAIDYTQVKALEEFDSAPRGLGLAVWGDVRLNRQIVGFKKIKFYTNENVGAGQLSLPQQEMHTTAFWLRLPAALMDALGPYPATEKQSGVLGLANALRLVASLLLMCDPRDLGVSVTEQTVPVVGFEPDLYLYDAYPGGIGQSQPLFVMREKLLAAAEELIRGCACEQGCPSCVGPVGEIGENGKMLALAILRALDPEALNVMG